MRDFHALEESFKVVQAENYQLRDYIINLQSRLIESQGDFPQPPSNIDLSQPGPAGIPPRPDLQAAPVAAVPTAPMGATAPMSATAAAAVTSHLQASAAQAQVVADMTSANKQLQHEAPFQDADAFTAKRQKTDTGEVESATSAADASKEGPNGTS